MQHIYNQSYYVDSKIVKNHIQNLQTVSIITFLKSNIWRWSLSNVPYVSTNQIVTTATINK